MVLLASNNVRIKGIDFSIVKDQPNTDFTICYVANESYGNKVTDIPKPVRKFRAQDFLLVLKYFSAIHNDVEMVENIMLEVASHFYRRQTDGVLSGATTATISLPKLRVN